MRGSHNQSKLFLLVLGDVVQYINFFAATSLPAAAQMALGNRTTPNSRQHDVVEGTSRWFHAKTGRHPGGAAGSGGIIVVVDLSLA